MSTMKKTRQQRRVSATRNKLLQAAREVFAVKGLDLARIDEITEKADVGKGTFYYHFKTKERLIGALIERTLGELSSALEEGCSGASDLREMLDRLITAHLLHGHMRPHHPCQTVHIRHGQRTVSRRHRPLDQLLRMRSTLQEAEIRLTVQFRVPHARFSLPP